MTMKFHVELWYGENFGDVVMATHNYQDPRRCHRGQFGVCWDAWPVSEMLKRERGLNRMTKEYYSANYEANDESENGWDEACNKSCPYR